MSEWYYTSAGQQLGPVSSAQLKQAAQSGQLTPNDLVWKDGMPDWVPATKLKGIFDGAPAPTAAAPTVATAPARAATATYDAASSAPTAFTNSQVYAPHAAAPQQHQYGGQPGSQIGYYNPTAGLGGRVAHNLKGFPPPTGPQTDWPLSDTQLGQLIEAEKQRKLIRSCANLFNALCLLYAVGAVLFLILGAAVVGSAGPRRAPMFASGFVMVFGVIFVALALLAFFAKRAVLKCRAWAPITFIVIFSLSLALNLLGVVLNVASAGSGPGSGPETAGNVIGGFFGLLIGVAFLVPPVRALGAIRRFLAAPVWAQEALVASKL